jgi:hypothetical protein
MRALHRFAAGFLALFGRRRAEQELDTELQEFLDFAIEDKMREGMSREAATRAARMELGSATAVKDHVRDVGWENIVDTTWLDVRYAARTLHRSPGFTVVAVLSLALGIGANTAIFSLINTVMLRSLPVNHPEQLVELLSRYPGEPRMSSFSWRHYEHFRDHNQSFSDLLAVSRARFQVTAEGSEPEMIDGEYVAGNFFTALGVRPALGRVVDGRLRRCCGSWRRATDPSSLGRRGAALVSEGARWTGPSRPLRREQAARASGTEGDGRSAGQRDRIMP